MNIKYDYYHKRILGTLSFIIPKGKKILFCGSIEDFQLKRSFFSKGSHYSKIRFVDTSREDYLPTEKFDYVILSGVLGKTTDIPHLLKNIQSACHPSTRIIVYQHNYLWQGVLDILESLGLKRKEGIQNWLSISDVKTYLESSGYEVTRIFKRTLIPIHLFGIGPFINWLEYILPFFDFLKLDQYILARPKPEILPNDFVKSLTICLTVRNEKDNIEGIVGSLPRIAKEQEILFVEGHSTDGTREEILRVMKLYPQKNIRVIDQPGKGQGDAIRVGFKGAKGDIIILYEGDGTSDVGDIQHFYEAMRTGRFEFIEGSRFVYPLSSAAMPLPNKVGNILFANWFSFFLGQRATDVLSGIKAILRRDYELLYDRWGFLGAFDPFGDFELLYGAARMGLKFGEIPIHYYPRTYGETKSKVLTHGLFLLKMAIRGYWIFRSN